MADLPRRLFAAEIGASAGFLLCYLWSWVAWDAKRRGGPHWVYFTIERLAEARNLGTRAVGSALTELEAAGLLRRGRHEGNFGAWLFTPAGSEDRGPRGEPLQGADQPLENLLASFDRRRSERRGFDPDRVPAEGDRRSIDQRSPATDPPDRSGISDHFGGDLGSFSPRSMIDLATVKEEQGVKHRRSTESAAAARRPGPAPHVTAQAAAADLLRSEAHDLLTQLAPPLAELGLKLPAAGRTLDLLAILLGSAGADPARRRPQREHVASTVLAFARVCVHREPAQRRWFVGEMFATTSRGEGIMPRWAAVEETVAKWQRRDEEDAAATRKAEQDRHDAAAQAEAQRQASERAAVGEWLADLARRAARPHALTPVDRHLAETDPIERARLHHPAEVLAVVEAGLARGITSQAELRSLVAAMPEARLPTVAEAAAQIAAGLRGATDRTSTTAAAADETSSSALDRLPREELINRRARLSELIRVALDDGHSQQASELSQARLELSRALQRRDSQPFSARQAPLRDRPAQGS